MNNTGKRWLMIMISGILLAMILPATALANSAEPPSLVILVKNPTDDLTIELVSNENRPEAVARRVAWEGYYAFYSRDMKADDQHTFKVTTKGESFECTLDAPLKGYNHVYTLDLANQTLTAGKYPLRSALLVSIRLLLTLMLEGILFWLFRFREKKSWLVFLAINLMTQGALNLWLNHGGPLMPNYLIFSLIFGEIFVFAAEMLAFPIFIKEQKKRRVLIYTFTANLVSLIAGGYIISVLPV